ncbi:hypothetical protein D3C71_1492750 [compost metagenome]
MQPFGPVHRARQCLAEEVDVVLVQAVVDELRRDAALDGAQHPPASAALEHRVHLGLRQQARDLAQRALTFRLDDLVHRARQCRRELAHPGAHGHGRDRFLAGEVLVDAADADAGHVGDVAHRRLFVALFQQQEHEGVLDGDGGHPCA